MKYFLIIGLLISSGALSADQNQLPTIKCKSKSMYLKSRFDFEVDLNSSSVMWSNLVDGSIRQISISESECEDSTDLKFNETDYQNLINGTAKSITGDIEHDEPGFVLKAIVVCSLK